MQFVVHVDTEFFATDSEGAPLLAESRGADALAAALVAVGHDVVVQETPLARVAPRGWILSFNADPEAALAKCGTMRRTIEKRLIMIDEGRIQAGELMDALRIPFVVTSRAFRNWLEVPHFSAGVNGRSNIARALHIQFDRDDVTGDHLPFDVLGVPLPEGIARCCTVLEAL